MIEFFVTGDFKVIQSQVYIILAMWVIMILAVCVDLWAGTDSAKARGEKIYSGGLRRTFSKLGDYWRIQVMALIFDLNYQYSCNYVYQQDYITKLVKRLNYQNSDTFKKMLNIMNHANEYLKEKSDLNN